MSVVHAAGFHVRHAVARALATTNQSPMEATFRVLSARVHLDARGRVASAEVSVRVERPRPLGEAGPPGLINPDGLHPLMARVPGRPHRLMDVLPVTWDRWARHAPDATPPGLDPWCPRTGVAHAAASAWAHGVGKMLPEAEDLHAAWGRARFPWGERPDATRGVAAPPRFGELPEVGWYPPSEGGFFDLGAWLHQWTADGSLLGGAPGLSSAALDSEPCGFRCVQEV